MFTLSFAALNALAVPEQATQAVVTQAIHADKPPRLASIDLLRGLIMVLMALDHTRDFLANARFDPTDMAQTTVPYFLTRWATHYCAPIFMFLAGVGAFMSLSRGRTRAQTSRFLWTRGVWLIVLECTLIHIGWSFNLDFRRQMFQVFWALGCSMIVLSALVYLPLRVTAAFGLMLIAGHNLFDGVQAEQLGAWRNAWIVLHQSGSIRWGGMQVFALYPLVPWVGVMAVGYAFGPVFRWEAGRRQQLLLRLGTALVAAFVVLRALNVYGDPHRWVSQPSPVFTLLDFLNCTKYPPSLLYLLMTLGPALLALYVFERHAAWAAGRVGQVFVTFGRVPLFYYLLHLPLLHFLAVAFALARYGSQVTHFSQNNLPPDYGFALPVVYLIWLGAVALLYSLCRRFEQLKRTRRSAWLTYL